MGVGYGIVDREGKAIASTGAVQLLEIDKDNWTVKPIHSVEELVNQPRSVHVDSSGHIFISDTFYTGADNVVGRALVTRIATGKAIASTPVYYPNDIKPALDGRWLICAEHENRLIAWDWNTGAREIILSAPVAPFNDLGMTAAQIVAALPSTVATSPAYNPEYSPAQAERCSGVPPQ